MPIRESERTRYPANWSDISERIRFERAGGRCECEGACGLHQGHRCKERHGRKAKYAKGIVVLTTAHLDHTPENCDDDNLRALCQRCHLRYDRWHHAQTRNENVDRKRGQERLPLDD